MRKVEKEPEGKRLKGNTVVFLGMTVCFYMYRLVVELVLCHDVKPAVLESTGLNRSRHWFYTF